MLEVAYSPCAWELEAGGSDVQDYPWTSSESEANLVYLQFYHTQEGRERASGEEGEGKHDIRPTLALQHYIN